LGEHEWVMPKVFISHSSKDTDFCLRLQRSLHDADVEVWLDATDLRQGQAIETAIRKAIATRDFIVVVLSQHSAQSPWAHFEVGLAASNRLSAGEPRVLPLVIDDVALPIYVAATRFVDFRPTTDYDAAVAELVRNIVATHASILRDRRRRHAIKGGLALALALPTLLAGWLYWQSREDRRDELSVTKSRIWDQVHTHRAVARDLSERLFMKYPDDPEVLRVRGWVLHFDHRSNDAIALFSRGLDLVGDKEGQTAQNLSLGKANALVAEGSPSGLKEARELYSMLIKRWRYENAFTNIGMLSLKEGLPAQAATEFEEARTVLTAQHQQGQVNPALAYVHTGLAVAQATSGQPVEEQKLVNHLKQAVCYQRAVLLFLILGEQSIGYFGYLELASGWAKLKQNAAVRDWLRTVDLAQLKPGQVSCTEQ